MGFIGCASHEIRALTAQPIEAYTLQTVEAGVSIAAKPFSSKEEVEKTFYLDLTEEGFVPILLVMENRTGENILLLKEEIDLVDSQGNVHTPIPAGVMAEKFEHNKMAYALLGFGIFSYMSAEEANKKMRTDWSGKELPAEKVLRPHRKIHGVVYFQLAPGLATLPNATLHIPLRNMKTGQSKRANLRITPGGRQL
jgi:hypothetical protein